MLCIKFPPRAQSYRLGTMRNYFWPKNEPKQKPSDSDFIQWGGQVSASGARSQFLGAVFALLTFVVTLILLIYAWTALKSTNIQLKVTNDQLIALKELQQTFLDQQKTMAEQLKILNAQHKAYKARIKPRFQIIGYFEFDCDNPDKNKYNVKILNLSNNPAKKVVIHFLVLMENQPEFEELTAFSLGDFGPNGDEELISYDIAEKFNRKIKEKHEKALTKKDAITAVRVYLTYKDDIETEYNDINLNEYTALKLNYKINK